MTPTGTETPGARKDILIFELDELRCAIDASPVSEVIRAVAIRTLPGQPPFVAGVIDLRGTIVPVLDLRVRFGRMARELSPSDHFVITESHGRTVALWVDAVVDVTPFADERFRPVDGLVVGARSLSGVARTAHGVVLIHDFAAFLNESEAQALLAVGIAS